MRQIAEIFTCILLGAIILTVLIDCWLWPAFIFLCLMYLRYVVVGLKMATSETYTTKYGEIVEEESSDEEECGIPYQEKLTSSIYISRITSTGKVLWKQKIDDDIGNKDAALLAEASKEFQHSLRSLPCHKYRSLLPGVAEGSGPQPTNIHDAQWLLATMRSILAKAIEVEKATKDDNGGRTSSTASSFPLLAYRFFDGNDIGHHDTRLVEGLSLCSDPSQEARDGDRWALYHGVRQMMTEDDAEASLFFELLDECNGQDALAFVLEVLIEANNEAKMNVLSPSSSCTASIPGPILLPLPVALELTSRLFTSTTSKIESHGLPSCDIDSLTQGTMDLAVEKSRKGDQNELHVDLFEWLVLVAAQEYYREVNRRKSLARLLFDTAPSGTLTSYCPRSEDKPGDPCTAATNGINFPQFEAVMEVLWQGIPRCEVDKLYSRSYEFQRNVGGKYDEIDGITLEAFLHVADERRFFVRSRRPGLSKV